jgi:hypothetical protein
MTGSGDIDPGASGSFLLGKLMDPNFAAGYIEVWAANVMYDTASGMVSFDLTLTNFTEWPIPPAIHFVITWISPPNIAIVDIDGETRDGFPFYDFSDKLGPDGILDVGESTEPVTARFHTVIPQSFGIGFRIDLAPMPPVGATIEGVVFRDDNRNGVRDRCRDCGTPASADAYCHRCEPGIPDITVSVDRLRDDGTMFTMIARTDQDGRYRFTGFDQGVHKIFVHPPVNVFEITSSNPLLVTLIRGPGGEVLSYFDADFGLYPHFTPGGQTLFGPVLVGPMSMHGTLLDSTFVDSLSILPVIHRYFLEVTYPPFERWPIQGVVDTASAWINDVMVYDFSAPDPPDSNWYEPAAADTHFFVPEIIELPEGLIHYGPNQIRLFVDGNDHAVLLFRVFKRP